MAQKFIFNAKKSSLFAVGKAHNTPVDSLRIGHDTVVWNNSLHVKYLGVYFKSVIEKKVHGNNVHGKNVHGKWPTKNRSTRKKRPRKKGPSENEEGGINVHIRAEKNRPL